MLTDDLISNHRIKTYHIQAETRVLTREQAIAFVNERGFEYYWPIKGANLPVYSVRWQAIARLQMHMTIRGISPGDGKMTYWEAREKILMLYLRSVGGVAIHELKQLFGGGQDTIETTIKRLVRRQELVRGLRPENQNEEWLMLNELFQKHSSIFAV